MDQSLQKLLDFIDRSAQFSPAEKLAFAAVVQGNDSAQDIPASHSSSTEIDPNTTITLLKTAIAELAKKNRLIEIEAALEKVRASTMAMHSSEEVTLATETMFNELENLGISNLRCGIANIHQNKSFDVFGVTNLESGNRMRGFGLFDMNEHPVWQRWFKSWNSKTQALFIAYLTGQEKEEYFNNINKHPDYLPQKIVDFPDSYFQAYHFSQGSVWTYSLAEHTEQERDIMTRFAAVFSLTFQRYEDLLKAESQAREAEIELALERVRAQAMSMHQSEELLEVCKVMYKELKALGFDDLRNTMIHTFNDKHDFFLDYDYSGDVGERITKMPTRGIPVIENYVKGAKINSDTFLEVIFAGKELESWRQIRKETGQLEDPRLATVNAIYYYYYTFDMGDIGISTFNAITKNKMLVLERFKNVFQLSYQRYQDIEKAEAQAKEAQIEAALERVRTAAMAMHSSEDLLEVTHILRDQVALLGEKELESIIIHIYNEQADQFEAWYSYRHPDDPEGRIVDGKNLVDWNFTSRARLDKEKYFGTESDYTIVADHAMLKEWYEYLHRQIPEVVEFNAQGEMLIPDMLYYNYSKISGGALLLITNTEASQRSKDLLNRAAKVFNLVYARFLDLQNAEAQAREAEIQLALERVRSRSLAMHHSNELKDVVAILFQQLKGLNIGFDGGAAIHLFNANSKDAIILVASPELTSPIQVNLPFDEEAFQNNPIISEVWNAKRTGKSIYNKRYSFAEKNKYFEYVFKHNNLDILPQISRDFIREADSYTASFIAEKNSLLGANSWSGQVFSENDFDVLKRAAKTFEQAYVRFLDLQKAEAQAREAHIELGLERVRARAMAMQKSEELSGLVATLFEELTTLQLVLYRCIIWIFNPETLTARVWMANSEDKQNAASYFIQKLEHPYYEAILKGWKERTSKWVYDLQGAEKKSIDKLLLTETELTNLPESVKTGILASEHTVVSGSFNNFGLLEASGPVADTEEQLEILNRFGKVFDLTYTRFNDLKQAEAQAREARIEAGLERVRARTMAMHSSEDVSVATATMFTELEKLGIENFRGGIAHIRKNQTQEVWSINTTPGKKIVRAVGEFDMRLHPFWQALFKGWKNKDEFLSFDMSGKTKEDYIKLLSARKNYLAAGVLQFPDCTAQVYFYGAGGVWAFSHEPHSEESKQVMKRFASVFSLTFRRYQDLQKAEAQTREALIEAALERVRSRAMAMHTSQHLAETIKTFYHQLETLTASPRRLGIGIMDKESHSVQLTTMNSTVQGDSIEIMGTLSLTGHPVLEGIYTNWVTQTEYRPVLQAHEINDYYKIVRPQISYPDYPANAKQFGYFFFFPEGGVYAWTDLEMEEEDLKIYRRFTSVLSLTYRRYKELKEAEAQTRQAQVETAMEKVRARALAMQQPGELKEVAAVLRREMGLLGVEELETSSIYILYEETSNTMCWFAIKKSTCEGQLLIPGELTLQLPETSVGRQMLAFCRSGENQVSIPMSEEELREWVQYCKGNTNAPDGLYAGDIACRFYHLNKFSNGYIGAASGGNLSAESWDLLQRATTVFSLAYTRYSDLQRSEANAREALRRAALDRVRAEIASMRTVADLERITPLVWNELTVLGIPFIRCGVFIMDSAHEIIHTFLSTPEGKAIAAFHIPYETPGNIGDILESWKQQKVYIARWDEAAFTEFAYTLVKQGVMSSPDAYLKTIPHGGFFLHFLPFLQGMLYVGNVEALNEEETRLIQSVADAFSTAYARYEDFNKLEVAKKQIENTLKDLKQAQTQLIQSEKMASLGELTAGIAHEIQNPLNFVNNFSEVNSELLDELEREVANGNFTEVHAIAKDIRENEQKINHHGRRADAIVKGMLEHSRMSGGIKIPTDINKLADEYLRLAYHGFRAKDKSFNALLNTHYDESLPLIPVVPQDVGRVVLNLVNNAFYAVVERKKLLLTQNKLDGYEPTITLSTQQLPSVGKKEVIFRIADNGNGIPQKVVDKIFQPFFTTKPTGQGTGLGLSLAYDIIKAHSGEIMVETKEGEGSEFVITLPATGTG